MHNTIFHWEKSLDAFLDPHHHITPLVELPAELNPFLQEGVHIFLKMQTFLPLWNIKSISARGMLNDRKEDIHTLHTLIENSSGNTAFSLCVLWSSLGIHNTKAIVSNQITAGKLQLLQLFNVEIIVNEENICPNPNDPESGIHKARHLWSQPWYYNPWQYDNPSNPHIHYTLTGAQLWKQLQEIEQYYNFKFFCAWLWTTGSCIGISQYLKEQKSDCTTIWVVRKPNNPIPWPRTLHLLNEISFERQAHVDRLQAIGTKQAYEKSLELLRAWLVVGPSAGMALCGLLQELQTLHTNGTLKDYTHWKDISAVVLCPDSPYLYLDEYFKYCDPSLFPPIHNGHLLSSHENAYEQAPTLSTDALISPNKLFEILQTKQKNLTPITLIDLRTIEEFSHVHIPTSINIPFDSMTKEQLQPYHDTHIIFICNYGKKSALWTRQVLAMWWSASSLDGGLIAWSDLWFPRQKAKSCQCTNTLQ